MTAKYRAQVRREQREKRAAEISSYDQELLEAMRNLRRLFSASLGEAPRAVASRALQYAIDDMAGVITGNREYFWSTRNPIQSSSE